MAHIRQSMAHIRQSMAYIRQSMAHIRQSRPEFRRMGLAEASRRRVRRAEEGSASVARPPPPAHRLLQVRECKTVKARSSIRQSRPDAYVRQSSCTRQSYKTPRRRGGSGERGGVHLRRSGNRHVRRTSCCRLHNRQSRHMRLTRHIRQSHM